VRLTPLPTGQDTQACRCPGDDLPGVGLATLGSAIVTQTGGPACSWRDPGQLIQRTSHCLRPRDAQHLSGWWPDAMDGSNLIFMSSAHGG